MLVVLMLHLRCEARTVAFFYALERDWAEVQAEGAVVQRNERVGAVKLSVARLGAHTIVAAPLGVGQAESAVVVATVLARHRVELVFSTGAVGGIGDSVAPGDGLIVGQIRGWQAGTQNETGWKEAERGLVKVKAIDATDRGPIPDLPEVVCASAEVFVASEAERIRLAAITGAAVVDMNLYGMQRAMEGYDLPALHLRIVSDRADSQATADFAAFVAAYEGRLGKVAGQIIRALPVSREDPESRPELKALLEK